MSRQAPMPQSQHRNEEYTDHSPQREPHNIQHMVHGNHHSTSIITPHTECVLLTDSDIESTDNVLEKAC